MNIIAGVMVSDVDKDDDTISIGTLRIGAKWLNSEQVEELIEDLQNKLKEMKNENP